MKKEAIICLITIILIFIGNLITGNYTKSSIGSTNQELKDLKESLNLEEVNQEDVKSKIYKIHENWDGKYNTLAFYIEHNELEKIETELTGLRTSIETEEYEEALNELDRAVYLLNHIEEKNKLSWKNIF